MKINDIDHIAEGKASVASAERELASGERGLSRAAAKREALRRAAGQDAPKGAAAGGGNPPKVPDNPYAFNYDNAPKTNRTGELPPKTKAKEPELTTAGERVPPQIQARIDAEKAAAAKAAEKQAAAGEKAAAEPSGTSDSLKGRLKRAKVATVTGGAALAGAEAIRQARQADKEADKAEKAAGTDNKPAAGTDNKPAVPADNATLPTKPYPKGSPYYQEPGADNDSRQSKAYPTDAKGTEIDPTAKSDIPKIDAISPRTTSGYKGSKGSQAIQALNPEITDVNKIRTGQEIKMPDGSTYTVQKGDALDRIARNAGLTPKAKPEVKAAEPAAVTPVVEPDPNRFGTPFDATGGNRAGYSSEPVQPSVDTRDGTGDLDKETPARDYSSGRPVDKELDDKYGTSNTRTDDQGRTFVRQKGVMGQPDSEQRSYASFGDFWNKIRGKGDINGKVADEVKENSELNMIKKLSSITESQITQVDKNMDFRKLLAIMSETKMADLKGKKHTGTYGTEHDTDEEGEAKKRGGQESDATKDAKKWQGAADAAKLVSGGKSKKVDETKMADIKGKKHTGTYGTEHDTDEEGESKKRGGQESDATKDSKKWQGAADAAKIVSGGKKSSLRDWIESTEQEILSEKAVSKAQQKFMGMVHAAQKGEKPASKEVAKVAKSMGKKDAKDFASTKHKGLPEKVKEDAVAEELKGKQTKLDKNKNGKLDSEDFKMLRKTKVDEGVNLHKMMTEKQQKVDEMLEELQQEIAEFKATGEMGDKLRDALDLHTYTKGETLIGEGDDEVADKWHDEDMARLGDEGKADAQHMQDLDRSHDEATSDLWRMSDLARDKTMGRADAISLREEDHAQGDTVYHRGQIGVVDRVEGNKCFVHKPNGDMDVWPTHECSKKKQGHFDVFKKDVQDIGSGFGKFLKGKSELEESPFAFESKEAKKVKEEEDQPRLKATKTDTGTEVTSNTGRVKATFEPGKETKVEPVKESMAYDVWNHQLEKMISESLTVTTTKGDNGTDDSVSVTASGNDANDIMAILRNAGIGSMGAEEEQIEHPTSAYGAPEGEAVGVVQIDGPEVIDGGDTMLDLMKKIANINDGHAEHEGHEEHDSNDYADENGEEEEVDEGNAFTGALKDTPQGGEFELDGKEYTDTSSLEEDEVEEGNAFTGALKDTPKGGEFEVDGKKYTDTSSLEEGHDSCNECGMYESECSCSHEKVEEGADDESAEVGLEEAEYANSDDDQTLQDIKFMTNFVSGGLNGQKTMHKHGYRNGDNPLAMRESADQIDQWKRLSGIK